MKVYTETLTIGVPLKDLKFGDVFILPSAMIHGSEVTYIKTDFSSNKDYTSVVSLTTGSATTAGNNTPVIPVDVTVVPSRWLESDVTDRTDVQFCHAVRDKIERNYFELHDAVLKIVQDSFKIRHDKYSGPVPPCDDTKLMYRRIDDIIIKIQEVICNGKTS